MDKAQLITTVRQHVTKAEPEKALDAALAWLATATGPDRTWLDTIRSLKAQFERTRQQQQRSIISYEQAQLNLNQINHYLLEAMEGLEEGRHAPAETPDATDQRVQRRTAWWWWAIGGLALVAAVTFIILQTVNAGGPGTDTPLGGPVQEDSCPSFARESSFNIMVLPFQRLSGDQELNIHTTLQLRLSEYSQRYQIPASVQIGAIDPNEPNRYPTNGRQAEKLARPCRANLIIWGRTIKELDGSNLVYTSYRLLDKDYFTLTDFELDQNAQLDTLTSLSSILTDGTLTQSIEQTILMLFGMVAHETENYAAAVEVFEDLQIESREPEIDPQMGVLLADSYVRLEQPERALPILNRVLEQDSSNLEATTMRGNLLFQQGQYEAALNDLDRAVAAKPDDNNLRAKRATANIRTSRLDLAREDLQQVQRNETDAGVLSKIHSEYQTQQRVERERLEAAEERIERNPRDTTALRIKAEAARNLGEYEVANLAATQLLQYNPRSAIGLATLMEIKPQLQDTQSANRVIEAAKSRISEEEIYQVAPRLRNSATFQNPQIQQ